MLFAFIRDAPLATLKKGLAFAKPFFIEIIREKPVPKNAFCIYSGWPICPSKQSAGGLATLKTKK